MNVAFRKKKNKTLQPSRTLTPLTPNLCPSCSGKLKKTKHVLMYVALLNAIIDHHHIHIKFVESYEQHI